MANTSSRSSLADVDTICTHRKTDVQDATTKDQMRPGASRGECSEYLVERRQQLARQKEIITPAETISSRWLNGTTTATMVRNSPEMKVPHTMLPCWSSLANTDGA